MKVALIGAGVYEGEKTVSDDYATSSYTYRGSGGTGSEQYERAHKAGRVGRGIPVNHKEGGVRN